MNVPFFSLAAATAEHLGSDIVTYVVDGEERGGVLSCKGIRTGVIMISSFNRLSYIAFLDPLRLNGTASASERPPIMLDYNYSLAPMCAQNQLKGCTACDGKLGI